MFPEKIFFTWSFLRSDPVPDPVPDPVSDLNDRKVRILIGSKSFRIHEMYARLFWNSYHSFAHKEILNFHLLISLLLLPGCSRLEVGSATQKWSASLLSRNSRRRWAISRRWTLTIIDDVALYKSYSEDICWVFTVVFIVEEALFAMTREIYQSSIDKNRFFDPHKYLKLYRYA
jgi:hypothetical protein